MAQRNKEHLQLPFPNGWYPLCWSHELHIGEVRPVDLCGEEIVLFRGRSGEASVLDAFCPHMGAHLGHGGRVIGDTVRCPYHAWQFDGSSGECTEIPYCDKIPERAKVKAWQVRESNNLVYCWYHPEDADPLWELPVLEEFNGERAGGEGPEDWSVPLYWNFDNPVHVQDAHENNLDPAHIVYLHGGKDVPLDPEAHNFIHDENTPKMTAAYQNQLETAFGPIDAESVHENWSIGMGAIRMRGDGFGFTIFFSIRPITENRLISYVQLTASNNIVDAVGGDLIARFEMEIPKDRQIWANKVYRDKPVLCQADKPLAEYRKWAKQFYCKTDTLK